jgi:Rrf2 family protein
MIHQKTSQNAMAAMSRLAELYAEANRVASSREIAESRDLSPQLVAKILTDLSRGGLVTASPGPGGGYRLAKPPHQISLDDIVRIFERETEFLCPFGPNWCGKKDPCPLHFSIIAHKQIERDFLKNTTLAIFSSRES